MTVLEYIIANKAPRGRMPEGVMRQLNPSGSPFRILLMNVSDTWMDFLVSAKDTKDGPKEAVYVYRRLSDGELIAETYVRSGTYFNESFPSRWRFLLDLLKSEMSDG